MSDSPAVVRGVEMMGTPMNKLPASAMKFMRYMCKKYMMCGEVMLTSYIVYAQIVEGLDCYRVHDVIREEWEEAQAG